MTSIRMELWLLPLGAMLLCASGCAETAAGPGGGAVEPVKVVLLTEGVKAGGGGGEAAATGPKIETFGTFRGRVVVTGQLPQLPPDVTEGRYAGTDNAVCSVQPIPPQAVVIGPDNGLANVFVFLRRLPNVDVPPAPSEPVVIDQKGCIFLPHASFVRVGQPLQLVNSDPVAHNVKLVGTIMSFGQTVAPGDKVGITTSYSRPERGPIPMSCDFHGFMSGMQLALDHPWAAITKPDGTFEITGVPAGAMEFVVFHEKAKMIESRIVVDVPADGVVEKVFEVDGAKLQ